MKRLLAAAIVLGIIVRVAPYLTSIFSGGYINFASNDAYYQINLISQSYAGWPGHGYGASPYHELVAGAGWLLSWGHGDIRFLETVSAFMPVLFFILTMPLINYIGRKIFSPRAGIIAAFALALLPGEYLGRSILGELDYHAFEVLLTTGIVACIVAFYFTDSQEKRILLSFVFVNLGFVYWNSWAGAIGFLPVMAAFIIPAHRKLGVMAVGLSLVLLGIGVWYSGMNLMIMRMTAETQPGFTSLFHFLHITIASFLLFLNIGGKFRWALFSWMLLFICATMIQIRFDYYLIIPLVIMIGAAVDKTSVKSMRNVIFGLLLVLSIPGYIYHQTPFTPSPAWHSALEWVKKNTPEDSLIVSWWDYGYWIRYIGQRQPYITPGQDTIKVTAAAKWFIDGREPAGLPDNTYLLVDSHMVGDYIPAIQSWSGESLLNNTPFLVSLYPMYPMNGKYSCVFADEDIKIYFVTKGS